MISKLCILSLMLLLIALANAQHGGARAQSPQHTHWGHQSNNEELGYGQVQGYQNGQQQFNYGNEEDNYPDGFEQANGAAFGRQGGARFGSRPGGGFRRHHYGRGGFRHRPAESEYGFRQPGSGFREQAGYDQQRVDDSMGQQHFGSGPGGRWRGHSRVFHNTNHPWQPHPDGNSNAHGFQTPSDGQSFQPQPSVAFQDSSYPNFNPQGPAWPRTGMNFPTEFQQPGIGQSGNPLQPRPFQGDRDTPNFNYQTPGNADRPLQPRPYDEDSFQQPAIQPRPLQAGQATSIFDHQQPVNANQPLQPRPNQANVDQQSGTPLQPRPTGQEAHSTPNQYGQPQAASEQLSSTLQPRPAQTDAQRNLQANIDSIFKTHDYKSSTASQQHESGHTKIEDGIFVDTRNILTSLPVCKPGTSVRDGHCRLPV